MPRNELFDYMIAATNEMADEYERIRRRALEDPGTAGDQGEENWATLLRDWLPSYFQVVTKGRILNHEGVTSPQVDIVVLSPSYPKRLLDKKLYLAGGVEAAFECKITLESDHIDKAVRNAAVIRKLLPAREGTPYRELHSPIVYGLLAHSHTWKAPRSTPYENVTNKLLECDSSLIEHPREMLDLVCVADLATWAGKRMAYYPLTDPNDPTTTLGGVPSTIYFRPHREAEREEYGVPQEEYTPIGSMLTNLMGRLAWEHPDMRELDRYFRRVNLGGVGLGQPRLWSHNVFSAEVKAKVQVGQVTNGVFWSEWSMMF